MRRQAFQEAQLHDLDGGVALRKVLLVIDQGGRLRRDDGAGDCAGFSV